MGDGQVNAVSVPPQHLVVAQALRKFVAATGYSLSYVMLYTRMVTGGWYRLHRGVIYTVALGPLHLAVTLLLPKLQLHRQTHLSDPPQGELVVPVQP